MDRLKKRAEFLAVARGVRANRAAFTLQAGSGPAADGEPRCGFTVTKKVGNAVVRNRVRRRLREAVRLDAEILGRGGVDHVLVGRREALRIGFADLRADLRSAFAQAQKRLARPAALPASSSPDDAPASAARTDRRGETPGRTR